MNLLGSIFSTDWVAKLAPKLAPIIAPFLTSNLLGVKFTYVRFSDFTAGGGTSPEDQTMQWNTVDEEAGNGFTHDSSNGTIITIVKAGIIFVDGNINNGGTMTVTKNIVVTNAVGSGVEVLNASAETVATEVRSAFSAFTVVSPGDKIRVHLNTGGASDSFNRMSMIMVETDLIK